MGLTVVVTGGCGFIGSHFIRLLHTSRPEWQIVNLDKLTYAGSSENLADIAASDRYRFVHGDICAAAAVDRVIQEEHPWAIVNFAAESHVDRSILNPAPFLQTNTVGVQVLLDAVQRHGIQRFVQISTDEVYGDVAAPMMSREDAPLRPSSPYAASKAAADHVCLAFHRTYGTGVVIARSANNYGPFQYPEKLIPLMIRNAIAGDTLPVYGDGGQVRDWLHVADNCEAILRVLERGQDGSAYNVGADNNRRNADVVREISQVVAEETHQPAQVVLSRIRPVPDRPGHDRRYAMDTSRIRTELGWAPIIRFQDGLRKTVRWYLEHLDWLQRVTTGDYGRYYEAVYQRRWNQDPDEHGRGNR